MDLQDALDKALHSYEAYYTIEREHPLPPFAAQAEFSAHGESYFLVKRAKYAEIDAKEFLYFALEDVLTAERAEELAALAWTDGMAKVKPHPNHRSSDVILVIFTGRLTPEAARAVKRVRYYRSYYLGLQGWSHFRLVALEPPRGALAHNRQGEGPAKLMRKIFQEERGKQT